MYEIPLCVLYNALYLASAIWRVNVSTTVYRAVKSVVWHVTLFLDDNPRVKCVYEFKNLPMCDSTTVMIQNDDDLVRG